MVKEEIADRVKRTAKNTDDLIKRLDVLSGRIDIAQKNENRELVEYYERQFAETSAEFMGGIETMIDDWYLLRGETRPEASVESLSPEILEEIHGTIVALIHGASVESVTARDRGDRLSAAEWIESGVDIAIRGDDLRPSQEQKRPGVNKQRNKVDLTG